MARRPGWPCAALLVAGVLSLVLGGVALYARYAVLDQRAFADRATSALSQDEVRVEIAQRIADREIELIPALVVRRPAVEAAVADVVEGPRFEGEFRAGASAMHRSLFSDRSHVTALALPGAAKELQAAVAKHSPSAAAMIPPADPELLRIGGGRLERALRSAAPLGRDLSALAPFGLAVGLALLVIAALRATTLRLGLRRAALGLALAGGVIVATTAIARAIVLSSFDTSHGDAVVGAIWSAFLADLRLWGLIVGGLGLVAAAVFEPGAPGAWRQSAARVMAPQGSAARVARAGGLVVLALLLLWIPEVPLDLALVSVAGLLVFSGVAEVVRLAQRSLIR
jgi:hypothetical protein